MKKRYLITLIIITILIIALCSGFAFAYFFTDIFKSEKKLFTKYVSQNLEVLELFNDEEIKSYYEKQKNSPYTSDGMLKTNVTFPDSSEAQLANALQNCNITFSGTVDNSNNYSYQKIKANYSETQSMNIELYKNGDVYAAKIDELPFKYIGIENNNLKELATKLQLPDQIASSIPNKIDFNQIDKISNIFSDEEKTALRKKYFNIITDNLTDDMFSKENSSEDSIYTLTLNENQIYTILVKVVEALKEDEVILGRAKEALINNFNLTETSAEEYISQYKKILQNSIDEFNSNSYDTGTDNNTTSTLLEQSSSNPVNIVIKVHVNNGKLLKTEIISNNNENFIIYKSNDGIKFEFLRDSSSEMSSYIQKFKSINEIKYEFSYSEEGSEIANLNVSFSGLDTNSINESAELSFDLELGNSLLTSSKTKFVSSYNNTKSFGEIQKEDIPHSEILLLNTAPSLSSIQSLFNNISTQTIKLNNSYLHALGLTESQNPFMYYIPSVITIGATYCMHNQYKSQYLIIPAFLSGVSTYMLMGDNEILHKASANNAQMAISNAKEDILLAISEVTTDYYSKKYSTNSTSTGSLYSDIENMLKNYNPIDKNIEYSYNNKIITIKSKKDPTKIITGVLSETGAITWK